MREDSPQWNEVGPSASAAENEALLAIKKMLPDGAIAYAWANLSFISVNGRLAESDLLLLTTNGLTLIELKGWHGRITGNQRAWQAGTTPKPNPLFLTDSKAKWLRSLLEYVQPPGKRVKIPFIRAITVLHGKDSIVDLDQVSAAHTFALDGFGVKGLPNLSEFLNQSATDVRDVVDLSKAKQLVAVILSAGFAAPPRVRKVGQYAIDRAEPIEQGPTWSDVIADHPQLAGVRKRIRLYDVPLGASAERRAQVTRIAQREFLLTRGLAHPGVVTPEDFFDDTDAGPALVFAHDSHSQRLDRWLESNSGELSVEDRLGVLRSLSEIIRYTHTRGVMHRALTPQQVYVSGKAGGRIQVNVRDWQTGREDPGADRGTTSPQLTAMLGTRHVADLADVASWVYLAPEVHTADVPDGIALDVYGLGSIGYFLITGAAPAANIGELEQRLRGSQGLDPAVSLDGIPALLRDMIQRATHPDARLDRTASAAAFLADLDVVEEDLRADAEPELVIDPLLAQANDLLDGKFLVESRLGSGSTGLALRVTEDAETFTVLKIAHDSTKESRLISEYRTLQEVDSHRIVKSLSEPFRLGGHLVLQLQDAGLPTLASRLRDDGRLTLDMLERWGADLLEAAAHLDSKGLLHRDIKPDNLGVRPDSTDRRPRLVLFDFSLAEEPLEHVKAGTPPYLDPFLGGARRSRYDRAAERFAIAVTLFEMATGQRPVWGTGDADPASITDEVTIVQDMFEPAVAGELAGFFETALARESGKRFGDLSEMAQAWASVFIAADAITSTIDEGQVPTITVEVSAITPLSEAGLSVRAQSALARLEVSTVGELLATSAFEINKTSGLGEKTRREIQHHIREWRRTLNESHAVIEDDTAATLSAGRGLNSVMRAFLPGNNGRNHSEIIFAKILLFGEGQEDSEGTWPSLSLIATAMGVTRLHNSEVLDKLRKKWLSIAKESGLHDDVSSILFANQGIAEVHEIGRALLATRGSATAEPQRSREAIGLVRAIIEADVALGGDSRFAARRIGTRVLIVHEPIDPDAPPADGTLDWVRSLADVADELAGNPSVAVRATALDALRGAAPPVGVVISDDRLLKIAAAASKSAEVGSRGEIYPRGLSAGEAIRLTLAGASMSRQSLTPESLAVKVAGRFPHAQQLPSRPALDQLVVAVDPALTWSGVQYGATVTSTSQSLLSTQLGITLLGSGLAGPSFDEIHARLRGSLESRSYLTLAVDPRRLDDAANVLTATYGLGVINLTEALIDAAKSLAQAKGVDWRFLLDVDAKEPKSTDRAQLNEFIADSLKQKLPALFEQEVPLLLTDPAPLGRYHQEQWLSAMADLATSRPAARWLLVPHRASAGAPILDDHVAVPLGADGYLTITAEFLKTRALGVRGGVVGVL